MRPGTAYSSLRSREERTKSICVPPYIEKVLTHQFHSALYLVDDGHDLVNAWHGHRWGIGQVGERQVQVLGTTHLSERRCAMRRAPCNRDWKALLQKVSALNPMLVAWGAQHWHTNSPVRGASGRIGVPYWAVRNSIRSVTDTAGAPLIQSTRRI
jgi:hypothetical protein